MSPAGRRSVPGHRPPNPHVLITGAGSGIGRACALQLDALRLEVRAEGIGVCLVVPGTIQSDIWRKEKQGIGAIAARPGVRHLYGTLIDTVAACVFGHADGALPAERVAEVVQRCLTSANPRIQYRAGWEAEVGSRAKHFIPDRLFDFLLSRNLGVPRRSRPSSRLATPMDCTPLREI